MIASFVNRIRLIYVQNAQQISILSETLICYSLDMMSNERLYIGQTVDKLAIHLEKRMSNKKIELIKIIKKKKVDIKKKYELLKLK